MWRNFIHNPGISVMSSLSSMNHLLDTTPTLVVQLCQHTYPPGILIPYLAVNKLYMMLQLAGVQLMLDDLEVGVKTVKAMIAKAKEDVSCPAQQACIPQLSSKGRDDAALIGTLHCCSCCSLSAAVLMLSAIKCCIPFWLTGLP